MRTIRAMTVTALLLSACSDEPDAAHQALQIRRGFEARLVEALRAGVGDIATSKSTATSIRIHAPNDGCARIYAMLIDTKAPSGLSLSCYSVVKGDQWRLWSNEISVLEAR